MWIICVTCMYVLCWLCFRVCSFLSLCGHLNGKRADLLALVCDVYCDFVTFPFGISGEVWYLIVPIPDHCCLSCVDGKLMCCHCQRLARKWNFARSKSRCDAFQ